MKKKTKTIKEEPVKPEFKTVKVNDHVHIDIYEDSVFIQNSFANQGVPLLKSTLKNIYKIVKNETL